MITRDVFPLTGHLARGIGTGNQWEDHRWAFTDDMQKQRGTEVRVAGDGRASVSSGTRWNSWEDVPIVSWVGLGVARWGTVASRVVDWTE